MCTHLLACIIHFKKQACLLKTFFGSNFGYFYCFNSLIKVPELFLFVTHSRAGLQDKICKKWFYMHMLIPDINQFNTREWKVLTTEAALQ